MCHRKLDLSLKKENTLDRDMQMEPLGEVHVGLGDQLLHHVFIHVCDRSFVSNRECATLLRLGLAYFEKHTGECLTEPWADNGGFVLSRDWNESD